MKSIYLFIYGTLKRGHSNHHWMRGQQFIAEARTMPLYRLFDLGGYPGMTEAVDGNGRSIGGEIWQVDPAGLQQLDILESVAEGEYELRQVRLAEPQDSLQVQAYFYLPRCDVDTELSGDWTPDLEQPGL